MERFLNYHIKRTHLIRHMRRTPYESAAAPMSNNATDCVELNVFAAPN